MSLLSGTGLAGTSANVATGLFAVFVGIQVLLAAGVLPVTIAWGGRQTELTAPLRLASLAAAAVLVVFAYVVRYRAGLLGKMPLPTWVRIAAWVVTVYMAVNTLGNFASTSRTERWLFGPLTAVLAVTALVVSVSRVSG